MVASVVFCIIAVSIVAALFLAWLYYQKARDRERMYLLEKGEKLEDIFQIQKRNNFRFIFPWLKIGIITAGMSLSFFIIAFVVLLMENDRELFKGFIITATLGCCLGASLIINHFVSKNEKNNHG